MKRAKAYGKNTLKLQSTDVLSHVLSHVRGGAQDPHSSGSEGGAGTAAGGELSGTGGLGGALAGQL